jgi:superfamily II DNA or RNA helicase
MQHLPKEQLERLYGIDADTDDIDNRRAIVIKNRLLAEFREQLTIGAPSSTDEVALRKLVAQIKAHKVIIKLFLRHPLHAKLYLLYMNQEQMYPRVGYLGSSNLTMSGLDHQGELNIDVPDKDATTKLEKWFNDRWNDHFCLDISEDLIKIIDNSWAREDLVPPYWIYLDMAYHLSQEAQAGMSQFAVPTDFRKKLFLFQSAAVQIAAHHLDKRGGVLIGDVVGLGKTIMATAVARIFDDQGLDTLIICPKNLTKMWDGYVVDYRLHAKVLSTSLVQQELPELRRYRLVVIDESHDLRNREGHRYRAIRDYIEKNDCKVMLLTATPYNKDYVDIANQLRLFIPEDRDLGIRPERYMSDIGERQFREKYQASPRSIIAFEHSQYPDDWRDLLRLYMVRRTRNFIIENYAGLDASNGRKYLEFDDGRRSYFPTRDPKTIAFTIDEHNPDDQYARLYTADVVDIISQSSLPRYGLGMYATTDATARADESEKKVLEDLSRAGRRLIGFCRTGIFKRLESGGQAFIQSIERHLVRNYVYLYALENNLPLPIGTQDSALLDSSLYDDDAEVADDLLSENGGNTSSEEAALSTCARTDAGYRECAAHIYGLYDSQFKKRFKWVRPELFKSQLRTDLEADTKGLGKILRMCGTWRPEKDEKLRRLVHLLTVEHPDEKVLIFSQFADTVNYLVEQLKRAGLERVAGATGDSADPTGLAYRFSPVSNNKWEHVAPEDELRVLVATDVLSEGQNLQDCHVVVNYDLPWAIIQLIQRAGRVDRIGQMAETITCCSFLPADGVERIIRLRERVRRRLHENAEVIGTDEAFFGDERNDEAVRDLYNEKAGLLDDDTTDNDVDLGSYAYAIWKRAIDADPSLKKAIADLPAVIHSAKAAPEVGQQPDGVLVYVRTSDGNDVLARLDNQGNIVSQSQKGVLDAAACLPATPALPRHEMHHEVVQKGVKQLVDIEQNVGGGLGKPSSARARTYERLVRYADQVRGTLFDTNDLHRTIEDIYRYPLRSGAVDTLNRQIRAGVTDASLAELAISLRAENRLSIIDEEQQREEPSIICSLGVYHVAASEG